MIANDEAPWLKTKKPTAELTGGNVNYYVLHVAEPKRLAPYTTECEDIIEALGMTFAEGCAFKAIWRSCAARTLSKHKQGEDPTGIYDAEKVKYYGARMLAYRTRLANVVKGDSDEQPAKDA